MYKQTGLTSNQKMILEDTATRLRLLCRVESNSALDSYQLAKKIGYSLCEEKKGNRTSLFLVEPNSNKTTFNSVPINPSEDSNRIRTQIAESIARYLVVQAKTDSNPESLNKKLEKYSKYLAISILMPKKEIVEMYNNLVKLLGREKTIDAISRKYGVDKQIAIKRLNEIGDL